MDIKRFIDKLVDRFWRTKAKIEDKIYDKFFRPKINGEPVCLTDFDRFERLFSTTCALQNECDNFPKSKDEMREFVKEHNHGANDATINYITSIICLRLEFEEN